MKMKKILILFISLLFMACSSARIIKQTSIREIQFGYGGGVTQSITRYVLKPDGKLYKGEEVIGKVARKELAHIYEKASSIDCEPFNMPSNTFSFIRIVKNDTSLYYCWNGVAPLQVMELDSKLYKSLPK